MANDNRKYFWLKLKEDWFNSKVIKRLRKVAGGDTYTIIYLKMLLKSLKDNGKLYFDGLDETFEEELALDIDENVDDVKMTVAFLINCGMLEKYDHTEYKLNEIDEMVGSETASTIRSRKSREKQKALQCNTDATPLQHPCNDVQQNCNGEIEQEKKREDIKQAARDKARSKQKVDLVIDLFDGWQIKDDEIEFVFDLIRQRIPYDIKDDIHSLDLKVYDVLYERLAQAKIYKVKNITSWLAKVIMEDM